MTKKLVAAAFAAVVSIAHGQDGVAAALANRVDEARRGTGAVAGIVSAEGRTYFKHGLTKAGGATVDEKTVFEIGSVTKVFTALLLAEAVERGEVKLDDPVTALLPKGTKAPGRNGREITLANLATHSSGLPRIPSNLSAASLENPYASYDPPRLYEFLAAHTLARDPGEKWEYSNLGAGLLGHALAVRADKSYEALLRERVLTPLGLRDTSISLAAAQRDRLAAPHDETQTAVPLWDFDALAGAGAIRSTATDMLTFAESALGLKPSPLAAAFARMAAFRRPGPSANVSQALGWLVPKIAGREALAHDGGTHGFRCTLLLDPERKRAAIAWINAPTEVSDIAAHLLEPAGAPLRKLGAPKQAVTLAAETLAAYAGSYTLAPGFVLAVTREGTQLFAQATGQSRFELFAEKEDEFFAKVTELQIRFVKEGDAGVTGLVLRQGGRETKAAKER